jgi:hypothetical protein
MATHSVAVQESDSGGNASPKQNAADNSQHKGIVTLKPNYVNLHKIGGAPVPSLAAPPCYLAEGASAATPRQTLVRPASGPVAVGDA